MEFKDVVKINEDTFNIQLLHPHFGWIPFTASRNDVEPHGRMMFEEISVVYGDSTTDEKAV